MQYVYIPSVPQCCPVCNNLTHCVGGGLEKSFLFLFFICMHTVHVSTAPSLFPFSLCPCLAHITVHIYGQRRVLMD